MNEKESLDSDQESDLNERQKSPRKVGDTGITLDQAARGNISELTKTNTRVIDGVPCLCLPLGVFKWIVCIPPAMRGKMKTKTGEFPAPQAWWKGVRIFINDNPIGDVFKFKIELDPDKNDVPHVEVDG